MSEQAWDEGYDTGYDDAIFDQRGLSTDSDADQYPHDNPYRNRDATDIDVAALRAAAEGAGGCGMVDDCDDPNHEWYGYGDLSARLEGGLGTHEAAEFVAAFKPSVVLELLDRLAAAEGAVARVQAVAGSRDFVESVVRKTCAVGPNEEPHHTCRLAGEAAALAMALVVNVGSQGPQIETEETR